MVHPPANGYKSATPSSGRGSVAVAGAGEAGRLAARLGSRIVMPASASEISRSMAARARHMRRKGLGPVVTVHQSYSALCQSRTAL